MLSLSNPLVKFGTEEIEGKSWCPRHELNVRPAV